jgi:DNA-binding protein HU-beta
MNCLELVEKIAAAHDLSKTEAARVLETVTGSIVASVKKGDPVQLISTSCRAGISRS